MYAAQSLSVYNSVVCRRAASVQCHRPRLRDKNKRGCGEDKDRGRQLFMNGGHHGGQIAAGSRSSRSEPVQSHTPGARYTLRACCGLSFVPFLPAPIFLFPLARRQARRLVLSLAIHCILTSVRLFPCSTHVPTSTLLTLSARSRRTLFFSQAKAQAQAHESRNGSAPDVHRPCRG